MSSLNYLLIAGAVVVIACGQILFKFAAQRLTFPDGASLTAIVSANLQPLALVLVAVTLYALSTVAWIQALRTVPLSVAFMFNALAFVLVPGAGFLLFGEAMPRYFFLALAMIVGGIFLVTRG